MQCRQRRSENSVFSLVLFAPCSSNYFRHGVCYIFNYAPEDMPYDELMETYSAGQDMGLNLMFNIETNYYMRYGLSSTEGVAVSLVEPYLLPEVLPSQYMIGKNYM